MKLVAMMMVAGVGAVGCAAETSAPPEENVGQTSEALTGAALGQHDAQTVVSAIFGGDLHGLPPATAGASCPGFRNAVSMLESDLAAGNATITNAGTGTVSGLSAILYSVADPMNPGLLTIIASNAAQCYTSYNGDMMITLFLLVAGTTLKMDPGPAQLTQNLSATRGSSAAATDSTTGSAVTAWQWPSSPSTGGSFAGGEPCSSVALSAGQSTSASILKSGSSLQYSTCK